VNPAGGLARFRFLALAAAGALSCAGDAPVRAQWLITLRTDAPLPLVADRLLVEITRENGSLACSACRRLFDAGVDQWPLSFGVAEAQGPLYVRARLYRARRLTLSGEPDAETTIDARTRLPNAPSPVGIELRANCLGVPSTLTESCAPETGELAPVRVALAGSGDRALVPGSWNEAIVESCKGEPPEGMTCVDGGLFFFAGLEVEEGNRDALVRISSFFLDRAEMTVGAARTLFAKGIIEARPVLRASGLVPASKCTYVGDTDASNDAWPLNCVDLDLARALCAAQGKRLPTDAELAYVAGNGAQATTYPWGEDDDVCAHAIVARGDAIDPNIGISTLECRSHGVGTLPWGPVAGGSASDLTLVAPGVRDLGGNLSEWVEDTFARVVWFKDRVARVPEPCWRGRPLLPPLVDPVCRDGEGAVIRGGSWDYDAWTAGSRFRLQVTPDATNATGLRCAKNAR